MNEISLKLAARTFEGKQVKKLLKQGIVPSVVYGGHDEPVLAQSDLAETLRVVQAAGKHTPIKLMLGDKKRLAIIKTIDFDPVKHHLRHIAFHRIKQSDIITTEVAIELTDENESTANRAGLVILQALETIEIKAKPADLPESIKLSVLNLASEGDRLLVSDIKLPNGVEFADGDQDMDLVIANVYEPGALQAANEAAGGEAEAEDAEKVEATEAADAAIAEAKAEAEAGAKAEK